MAVLLNSFHLNGQILGFHPQTQKLDFPDRTLNSFYLKGYTLRSVLLTDSKVTSTSNDTLLEKRENNTAN